MLHPPASWWMSLSDLYSTDDKEARLQVLARWDRVKATVIIKCCTVSMAVGVMVASARSTFKKSISAYE